MEVSCGWLGKPQAVDMTPPPDLTKPADLRAPDLASPSDMKPPSPDGHAEERHTSTATMLGMGYVR
jgi:hypothetical protein